MSGKCSHSWIVIEWEYGNIWDDIENKTHWRSGSAKNAEHKRARTLMCQKCSKKTTIDNLTKKGAD